MNENTAVKLDIATQILGDYFKRSLGANMSADCRTEIRNVVTLIYEAAVEEAVERVELKLGGGRG